MSKPPKHSTHAKHPKRERPRFAEVVIHSLGEFIDRVTPGQPDPVSGRRRDSGVYRGAPHAYAPILTSLDRLGGTGVEPRRRPGVSP